MPEHCTRITAKPLALYVFALLVLWACAAQQPQKDGEAFEDIGTRWFLLVRYLGCLNTTQFPTPGQVKSVLVGKWPLVEDLVIKHPLVLRVQIEPVDASKGYVVALVKQQYSDAPWEITEAWVESDKGARTRNLTVPSVEIQQLMNKELPRLIDEAEKAGSRGFQPPGCADK